MHPIDWAIVVGYIAWLVWDGVKRTRVETTTESYFLANRSLPWWAVGLSVMATQLSAITLQDRPRESRNSRLVKPRVQGPKRRSRYSYAVYTRAR